MRSYECARVEDAVVEGSVGLTVVKGLDLDELVVDVEAAFGVVAKSRGMRNILLMLGNAAASFFCWGRAL
jgi:hypothetical protein